MNNVNDKTLSVLSLNCWGLKVVAKQREFRLHAIGDRISSEDYDIVALQEVWMRKDFDYIKAKVGSKLPFTKYFQSGTLGSGLAILSRFPILSSSYLKFTLAGRPLKVLQGDFYVGKGCGSVCIDHPEIGLMDLQAGYGQGEDYEAQRITECWQIANSVRASAAQGRHVILAGDFNSIPTSNCYQMLKNHGFMTDTWLENHDHTQDDLSDSIQRFGITCDSPLNTWTKHLLKQEPHLKEIGDRLDYIFYRRSPQIICQESRVVMEGYIPGTEWSYSDHFGVHSVFTIAGHVDTAMGNFAPDSKQLARPDFTQLSSAHLITAIEIIQREYNQAKKTGHQYLVLLCLSVVVVVGAYIAQLISYEGSTQIIVHAVCGFVMIACSGFAMVCLIVGFVFGGTEQRSLDQYMIDLRVCLKTLQKPPMTSMSGSSFSTKNSLSSGEEGIVEKPMLKKLR
ncbi:hypothetical protein INT47_006855 [Mucor saturninus]|uniref:Endonuclease/exonuclease/phosphatase domain-containing protein n=1 Tax=Mucor saturninus TaxID=64648 RepID=A0A8H7V4Z8_9FUNG|nr:hypothetical protein INT47_006855 [Mucor saturninus]